MLNLIKDGPGYQIIKPDRQVDLSEYLSGAALRAKIGFATPEIYEDLHWEQSYEFIIPQDGPVTLKIFRHCYQYYDKGITAAFNQFQEVEVKVGQLLIIFPLYCHRVVKKNRFIALKVEGKFKLCAKPKDVSEREAKGRCPNGSCTLWGVCEEIYLKGRK